MAIETSTLAREQAGPGRPALAGWRGRQRPGPRHRILLLEQLILLLETGANLHAALGALKKECGNARLSAAIDAVAEDVANGLSFSVALGRHSDVFSRTYVNLIAAGEQGGFMIDVLKQLLQMEERNEHLRGTVKSAVAYPAFLSVFSAAVVIFVLVVVFPKFGNIFATIQDELPLSTRVLMSASDSLRAYWMPLLAILGGGGFAFVRWSRSDAGGEVLDRAKLRAPVLGEVFVRLYLVQALRPMSMSLTNGVSAVETLAACQDVVQNRVFRRFLGGVRANIEDGGTLAAGFSKATFIPSMVRQLVATGDESGALAKVMGRVADYYERELEKQLQMLSKLAEPVMLLVMGVVVGLIVTSLILPIFKLSTAVG